MTKPILPCLLAAVWLALPGALDAQPELSAAQKGSALTGGKVEITVEIAGVEEGETVPVEVASGSSVLGTFDLGPGSHDVTVLAGDLGAGGHPLRITSGGVSTETEVRLLPGWLSVVPPLVAIGLALIFKDVILSLFLGIFTGALFLAGWNPFSAFARSIDTFIAPALFNPGQAQIVVFSLLLGGMVGVISRSGGTLGIVERLAPYATNARRGQLATWTMGLLIFFDDYANTLIVGSTMRPITDRLRISREKLAYIVDSTAAPVSSVVPISTWIGFEVGLIATAFTTAGIPWNAYTTFVESIPYRFYPIFALVLGFTIAFSCRDRGPMLKAELRASRTGKVLADGDTPLADYQSNELEPPEDTPHRAINALLPILTVIAVTVGGLYATGSAGLVRADYDGTGAFLREVFANGNSNVALLWASLSGVALAAVLALGQRLLTVRQTMEALIGGFKAMLLAMVVLVLAWSIGAICGELDTADYLVRVTEGVLSPHWLPVLIFGLSAVVAFSTGTSWGTMGILVPLVIPVAHGLATAAGLGLESSDYRVVMLGTISSVLAGSVWGDHCSPISDTTILSSTASGSDHIAHVRTQLPYALAAGVLGMVLGDIPTAYGLSPWVSILVGSAVIIAAVFWLGKRSDYRREAAPSAEQPG